MIATSEQITWSEMVAIDNRLAELKAYSRTMAFTWTNYERIKCGLKSILGWGSLNPKLATSEAYEVAINSILQGWEP